MRTLIKHLRPQFDQKCDELKASFGQFIALVDSAKKAEEENARQTQILQEVNNFYEDLDAWLKVVKQPDKQPDKQPVEQPDEPV